jgi:hypothetical protein
MDLTVTKYLGPELPKQPRKFECIGNFCTPFGEKEKEDGKYRIAVCGDVFINQYIPWSDGVKFKATFEEIINEI